MTDKGYSYNYQTLLVGFDEGVCVLTLNRPDKRNAMNPTLGEESRMHWNICATMTGAECW